MSNAKQIGMLVQDFTLAAGEEVPLAFQGDYVRNIDQTGTGPLAISLDGGPFSEFKEGAWFKLRPGTEFQVLRMQNRGAASLTVTLGVALGEFGYDALQVSGGIGTKGGGTAFTDVGVSVDTTATLVLAANASRTGAIIRAGSSDLWLGGAGVTAHSGPATVPAGTSLTIQHTAAIYGIRASGSAFAGAYEETA